MNCHHDATNYCTCDASRTLLTEIARLTAERDAEVQQLRESLREREAERDVVFAEYRRIVSDLGAIRRKRDDVIASLAAERDAALKRIAAMEKQPPNWQPTSTDKPAPHGSMNAVVWVDYFLTIYPQHYAAREMLFGWFANAIMVGYDAATSRAEGDIAALRERAETLQAELDTVNALLRNEHIRAEEAEDALRCCKDYDMRKQMTRLEQRLSRAEELLREGVDGHLPTYWQVSYQQRVRAFLAEGGNP